MNKVYLSLGTNLGNKTGNLLQAIVCLSKETGKLSAISSVYETEPWGYKSGNNFLNMAVCIETLLKPEEILSLTKSIEKSIGREEKTTDSYRDRLIDIDLIAYSDLIINSNSLKLPHPLFHERRFVLEPLNEIAPDFVHPVLQKKVSELLEEL